MEDTIVNDDLIPPREKWFKKVVNKIFSLPLIPKISIVIATFIVLSIGVYFALAKDPQVAFMSIFGGGPVSTPVPATPPVTPPVYPSPSSYPTSCKLGVANLSMSTSCGMSDFRYGNYNCNNGTWGSVGNGSDCYSANQILDQAFKACAVNQCSPRPSIAPSPIASAKPIPSPSWPPTPPPTSDPTPLVLCTPEVYKLPSGLALDSLTSSALLPYKVDPYHIEGQSGDKYAINIVLKNIRGYDITGGALGVKAWTVNSLGASMPISIIGTGSDCNSGYTDKTVRCSSANLPIKNSLEVRPNMFHVFNIDEVSAATSGTINYNGIYAATPFSCPPTSINVNLKPTPTPVATAKPVFRTRYQLCRASCYAKFPFSNIRRAPCMNSCEARFR